MKPEASIENPRFRRALDFVLKWETVFDRKGNAVAENDRDDPGGLTKFGIDQRSHPNVNIRALTKELAAAIYHRDYWLPVQVHELPVPVGEVVFDIAVNNGKARAVQWLQEAAGVVADGFIGPVTLKAAGEADATKLAAKLISRRSTFYRNIAKGRKAKFLKGWLNRNEALRVFAATSVA
ncbi:MAG: glycosyl hydrolase 108 family protein [Verrucomicrobiota bacterium]